MLIGFAFKNFMSFYGENVFSMKSSKDTKFRELNTIRTEYGELLKSALILGANGSGKSNFIKAMSNMKSIVLAELNMQSWMIANVNAFLCSSASTETPSVFEVEFIADGLVFEYGFELLNGEVSKEYLSKKTKRKTPVFTRTSPDFKDISLSKEMDNVKELTKNTRRDNLFLYWASGGNNELAMAVSQWFENIQIFDTDDIDYLLSATVEYLEENSSRKDKMLDLLQKADVNILDFDIELLEDNEQKRFVNKVLKKNYAEKIPILKKVSLRTKRYLYNANWEQTGFVHTSVYFESAGTKKLFEIAGPIVRALENGSVVFIDEIDSKLHPKLVRFLVMMFNSISSNPKNAQLICNTHDALLLDEDIRRDQIYFTEKDEYGVSYLYSLADFKGVRKESKLLKQYLIGVFGATPRLKKCLVHRTVREGACEKRQV